MEPVLQELEAASVVASYSLTPMTCEGASPDRAEINPFAAAAHGMPTGLLGGGEDVGQMPCTKSYWKRPGSPVKTRMAVTGRIGHGRAGDEEPDAA